MIKLLGLVQKRPGLSPGQRFRLEQWAPLLRANHGISIDFLAFESPELTRILYEPGHVFTKSALILRDAFRRREVLSRVSEYDAVVIYREASLLGPAVYEHMLARTGVPLILDFDDAIWMRGPGGANGIFSLLSFRGKTSTICRLAQSVVVGNNYLANFAARYSSNVRVIPSTIDLDHSPVQADVLPGQPFTIVWIGSPSSMGYLDVIRGALSRLGNRQRTVLRIICSRLPSEPFAGVEVEFVRWDADNEAREIGRGHVGIMPLPDDEFTRGKCGLKALQYMAAARPVVASPVGTNTEIVTHGKNGLLAATEEQWISALESLAASPRRRRALGLAGRRTVEAQYSAARGAAAFANVVDEVLHRAKAS